MRRIIKKYINSIRDCIDGYYITGDGQGDFEYLGYYTTQKCLEDYIYKCEKQVDMARYMLQNRQYVEE